MRLLVGRSVLMVLQVVLLLCQNVWGETLRVLQDKQSNPSDRSLQGIDTNRNLIQTENYLFEVLFNNESGPPLTDEELLCLMDGVQDNMADIAKDYLIKELGYDKSVVWGIVEDLKFKNQLEKIAKEEARWKKKMAEMREEKQTQLEKEREEYQMRAAAAPPLVLGPPGEAETETTTTLEQISLERISKLEKRLEKSTRENESARLEKKIADEKAKLSHIDETQDDWEEYEAEEWARFEEELAIEQRSWDSKMERKRKKLEKMTPEPEDFTGMKIDPNLSAKEKKKIRLRRRRRRMRRAVLKVRVRCNLQCNPDNGDGLPSYRDNGDGLPAEDSGGLEVDEVLTNIQQSEGFEEWMDEKMTAVLKDACDTLTDTIRFVDFSYLQDRDEFLEDEDVEWIFGE